MAEAPREYLVRRNGLGDQGYPIGTVAFYGPNDNRATKVVAAILLRKNENARFVLRRMGGDSDVRYNDTLLTEAKQFLQEHKAKTIIMNDDILGCPHEEGKDYPDGETCSMCPFWENVDRWESLRRRMRTK